MSCRCEAKVSAGAGFLRGRCLALQCLFKNLGLKENLVLGVAFKAYVEELKCFCVFRG